MLNASPCSSVIDLCSRACARSSSLDESGGKTNGFAFFPQTFL
jgi:hypothetical protein